MTDCSLRSGYLPCLFAMLAAIERLTARSSGPLGLSLANGFRAIALGKGPGAVPNCRDVLGSGRTIRAGCDQHTHTLTPSIQLAATPL